MKYMRAFIALTLNKQELNKIKKYSKKISEILNKYEIKYREVNIKNTHITLKFYANEKYSTIKKDFEKISIEKIPAIINITKVNTFGKRVVFLDINEQQQIKDAINTISEEKFHAHITTHRIKQQTTPNEVLEIIKKIKIHETLKIESIAIFESTLTPSGPQYKKLYEVKV